VSEGREEQEQVEPRLTDSAPIEEIGMVNHVLRSTKEVDKKAYISITSLIVQTTFEHRKRASASSVKRLPVGKEFTVGIEGKRSRILHRRLLASSALVCHHLARPCT
jgi:hypothetical protein